MPPDDGAHRPEDIFHEALSLEPQARGSFLTKRCAGDPELREEIARMLAIADQQPELLVPPAELELPTTLGRYELRSECGRGGMGVVYEAWDTQLDRRVALKVLPAHLAGDPPRLQAFRREARTLASLNDERIATLFSLEEAEGIHFLTMEFVEGETLATSLQRGPMDRDAALRLCRDVAEALNVAHSQGIVHRDLKPANIMVSRDGRVKILDFGIARTVAATDEGNGAAALASQVTTSRGTPAYMSPEQAAGRAVDPRTDVWSFGCILFECLAGKQAFESAPGEGDRLGPDTGSFPAPISALVQSCLEADLDRRTASMAEASRTLQQALAPKRRRLVLGIAVAAAALASLAMWATLREPVAPLASLEVENQRTLRAVAATGETLWLRQFSERIGPNHYQNDNDGHPVPQPQTVVQSDGKLSGVVLSTVIETSNGTLWCLDPADGSTRWQRPADWVSPVNERGPIYYRWNTPVRWPGRDGPVVATLLRDDVWYSSAVQFVSLANEVLGTYYHPGPLYYCCQIDLGSDGAPVVLYGTNSSARLRADVVSFESQAHCGVVILLDLNQTEGQAFPYSEGLPVTRDWPEMTKARELAYLLIPPLTPTDTPGIISVRAHGEGDATMEVGTTDGRFLRTDALLRPLWCYASPGSPAAQLRSEDDPTLDVVYIQRGTMETVSVPVRF